MRTRLAVAGAALTAVGVALAVTPAALAAPADYDSNGDHIVDRTEVLAAIGDYLGGAIGTDEVLEVIVHYLTGAHVDPVPTAPGPELASLTLSHGEPATAITLAPPFGDGASAYAASVGYEVVQITVIATGQDGLSPMFVQEDGSSAQPDADGGTAGHQVDLVPGENVIRIRASGGGSERTYTVTITRARPVVEVIAHASEVREGEAVQFTVTRGVPASEALTVGVEVGETGDLLGPGAGGLRTVVIASGDPTAVLAVPSAPDDSEWDPHSVVTAALRAGASYDLGTAVSAQTQVTDDDFPPASATLAVGPNPVGEGGAVTATVTVTTAAAQQPHGEGGSITVSTRNGTATSPLDFSSVSSVHAITASDFSPVDTDAGMRYRAVYTTVIETLDDAITEGEEAFTVSMSKAGADMITLNAPSEVTVIVSESADASLTALYLTGVNLTPAFAPGTQAYTASVGSDISSTTVSAVTADAGAVAVVWVGGTADPDGTVELQEGTNVITVVVTAEDGVTTRTYTVSVVRDPPPPPIIDLGLSVDGIFLVGYWSDGTADVEGTITLTNLSGDAVASAQPVEAACAGGPSGIQDPCRWRGEVLGPGAISGSSQFRLRVPMGSTTLVLTYGGVSSPPMSLEQQVSVPERILGVSREVWNCYVDRTLDPTKLDALGNPNFYGCSGWDSPSEVHRLPGHGSVVMWATGDSKYVQLLRESVEDLSPILNLNVSWTDLEYQATLRAYVGIHRDRWHEYGLTRITPGLIDAAGFARSTTNYRGEVVPESVVVWHTEREWAEAVPSTAKHVIMHELLHALTGVSHVSTPHGLHHGVRILYARPHPGGRVPVQPQLAPTGEGRHDHRGGGRAGGLRGGPARRSGEHS